MMQQVSRLLLLIGLAGLLWFGVSAVRAYGAYRDVISAPAEGSTQSADADKFKQNVAYTAAGDVLSQNALSVPVALVGLGGGLITYRRPKPVEPDQQ